jgi:hypothetical protein
MRERLSTLLWKVEATPGVDAGPLVAANSIEVSNLNVTPMNEELVPRELARNFLGSAEILQASRWKTISFSVPISPWYSVGVPPKWGALLRCCGMGEIITPGVSVAYKPVSGAEESGTGYCNYDGQLEKILMARGTWSMNFRARQRPTFDFSFMGLFVAISDAGLPVIDLSLWIRPIPVNNANTSVFTLHGYAAKLLELTLQGNVETEYRNLVGMEQVDIADRAVNGTCTFEPPTIAAKDYFALVNSKAPGALQIVHGPVTNQVKVDLPAAQLINPERVTQGKFRYNKLGLHAIPTAAGNDEITITAL